MKKLIACLILVIMLAVPLTSYADEAVTEAEKWDMSVPAELTEDIQTLFDKAMENLVGVHYTPVAVLGARGNTYCIAKEWFRRALDAGYEPDEEDRALLEDVFGEGLSRQRIIEEMVVDYGSYGQAADEHVRTLLNNLRSADADAADRWDSIMTLWQTVNADLTIHENVLPDGLPNTDELCIVALGFQLNADGTMRDELIERLKVVLNSAEKYSTVCVFLCTYRPSKALFPRICC